jgi:hypothetical protein
MAENTDQIEIVTDLNIKDGKNWWGKEKQNNLHNTQILREKESEIKGYSLVEKHKKKERERKILPRI